MATAAAAVATRLACHGIEDQMTKDLGDDWLCSPPPPPGLATNNASDRPPGRHGLADEAETILRTEVAGQRFKFADVHWGRAATAVRAATGYVLTAQEARERYETSDREVSLLGAARSRPFWRRRLSRRAVVATPVEEDDKRRLSGGRKGKTMRASVLQAASPPKRGRAAPGDLSPGKCRADSRQARGPKSVEVDRGPTHVPLGLGALAPWGGGTT